MLYADCCFVSSARAGCNGNESAATAAAPLARRQVEVALCHYHY